MNRMIEDSSLPKVYHAINSEYSKEWHNDYMASAYFNLARDEDDNLQAHCFLLSVTPGIVSALFRIIRRSDMMLSVCVFKNDGDMLDFIKKSNGCIISATMSSGKELIKQ